jgi:cytochrome P450
MHDEELFPDPDTFRPERFWAEGKLKPAADYLVWPFGYGRRCVG